MNESRNIIIAGISSELGRVMAKELAKVKGVRILGTMRRKATGVDKFPGNVEILDECDLTNVYCCNRVAELADKRFKGPIGFIHSVGDFGDHVPFLEVSPQKASQMFSSHVATLYNILQSLVPLMRAKGG